MYEDVVKQVCILFAGFSAPFAVVVQLTVCVSLGGWGGVAGRGESVISLLSPQDMTAVLALGAVRETTKS